MNANQIISSLIADSFTNDELSAIVDAVKCARANLSKSVKRSIKVGATVKFTSNRNGMTYSGTVDKVKVKYVLVATPVGRFNVPANMLEVV
jgi:hypothetical protein